MAPSTDLILNQKFVDQAISLRSALLAAQKTLTIKIDSTDLSVLKTSGYRLCFAKKVGTSDYNVVWQSSSQYLMNNQFSWTPQYQLFGSNRFTDGVEVFVSTNVVTIGLGEKSTLNSSGLLLPASTGGANTALNLVNEFGTIHPGVNQLSTGIDGTTVSTPIYVATQPIVMGTTSLTPVEKILVWFEQNIETSTMFSNSRSKSIEIDLTENNTATRLYKNQAWSTP